MNQKIKLQYQTFLKERRKIKGLILGCQVLIFFGFIFLWQLASMRGWIDPLLFSSPSRIFTLLKQYVAQEIIFNHMYVTVMETVVAFLFSTIIGTLIAMLLWWSRTLAQIMDPYLVVLNAMPKVALGPIVIVIFDQI